MMSGKKLTVFGALVLLSFGLNGCASFFSVGETETYCEEHCASYKDAGVCATPYDIYKNRTEYAARAEYYNNCRRCK
jgi:hypothetical protein